MKEDHKQLPHSIVCDMYMPLMNGIELLQFLKNEPRWQHIPVFAFSTSCSTTESQNLLSAGATAFFTKPNSYDELKVAIEKILVLHNNT